jgi:DNA-binding CsgD family transcriptional regulator
VKSSALPQQVQAFRAQSSPDFTVEYGALAPIGVTRRQLQCLAWAHAGKSATDIGAILGVSGRTVEGHLMKVYAHLGAKTCIEAAMKARQLGLLKASSP